MTPPRALRRAPALSSALGLARSGTATAVLRALASIALVALTLGLAGCEAVASAYCDVFRDTRYCCERGGGRWNETALRCEVPPVVFPTS